ncbi:synaptic vesicle glycoprotein 2A-like [Ostrinia furnacalis]|uniref:synaptic vesicle glycoprotein 2A-like n=1 Tax=Ostrinia furnacalis TaxID=93504 RepID=UPI00103DDC37|nr:synaptic vesicle glycoprotein 2A-like [Ostrinia furnacalis]
MTTFEEAFEETGHGAFNYVVLVTCGLVLLYATVESLGIGYIITAAECDLGLTGNEKGLINAAAFIGIFSTAIIWGYLSDRFGRRAVMLPAIGAGTVVSFASSLSGNFWTLFILRFLTGCLVSASSATVYAYLGEMHTDSRRASAIAFGSTFIAFTFIVLPVMAWLILSSNWSFNLINVKMVPWRAYIWSWCTPGVLAAIIMVFLPESPRFLYAVKGEIKAIPVLARIYAWNRPLAEVMICFRSSGLYTWMPNILNEMLFNVHKSVSMCDIMVAKQKAAAVSTQRTCKRKTINPLVFPVSIAMGVICATTYVAIGYIMRTRNKICIYCSVLAVCSLMLAASSVLPQPIVAITLFIVGLCCGCAASVLAAIAVEVFPTSVRALALCTLYMAGRSGAAVGANVMGLAMREHCLPLFFANTLITAGSTLLMLLWPDPKAVRAIMEERGFAY